MDGSEGSSDEDLVRIYLAEIGRHPLLTKVEEVDLARLIEAGREASERLERRPSGSPAQRSELRRAVDRGEAANLRFVQSNLRLVVSIAKRYQGSGVPLLDLVQEGNLGLIHAVDRFDWRKGFKFSTYATWWIRQAITRGIANTARTIRLPVHAGELAVRIQRTRSRLTGELGRAPTREELANASDVSVAKLDEAAGYARTVAVLSDPVGEEGGRVLADAVVDTTAESPFDAAASSLLRQEVANLLSVLSDREQSILRLRFGLDRGEPRTLEEVGLVFGLTRERIRQIEATALSKLRSPSARLDLVEPSRW